MFWNRGRFPLTMSTFSDTADFFNRLWNESFRNEIAAAFPAFNVWANADGAVITGELPGVKMEDLEITASGKSVSIKGARKSEAGENSRYLKRERHEGEFNRGIELPFQIDAGRVEAKLANGVLRISLPRAEHDKPRRITVNVH